MIQSFQWLAKGVEFPDIDTAKIEEWIVAVAREHGKIVGDLSYIFCDDEEILRVNRQYINHDYYTDIITFDDTSGRLIRGDIFISLDTVKSNAELVNTTYNSELHRVIIHGVLHLCGIDDKGPGEREIMEAHEDAALALLSKLS